jgi:hypothetical protein
MRYWYADGFLEFASLSHEKPELDVIFLKMMEKETICLFLANCFLIV